MVLKICFFYQPAFNKVELKIDMGGYYDIRWKSKSLFKSEICLLHGAFLPNIKYFGYKIGILFNNTLLVVQ